MCFTDDQVIIGKYGDNKRNFKMETEEFNRMPSNHRGRKKQTGDWREPGV